MYNRFRSKCGSIATLFSCYLMTKIKIIIVKINRPKKYFT